MRLDAVDFQLYQWWIAEPSLVLQNMASEE